MSVAPFAGVVALDNFKSPTAGEDGIQGQVPKPLAGQIDYVLTANGWASVGGGTVTSVTATAPVTSSGGTAPNIALTTSGANSVVIRDANQNISVNCLFEGYATVAASGTTIVLTASSAQNYQITGSGGQVIRLPDATTLPNGATFTFNNNQSSGAITVQNNSSTTIATINSGGYVTVVLLSNSIAAGSWDRHDSTPSNVSWSTNTLDYPGSITSATWNGTAVAINRGGTGASTASGARTNLGLGTIATQDSSAVAVTGGTIDGTVIGGTTAAAGTFTTLIGGSGSANYEQITGGATGKAVQFQSLGSDAAVSLAIQSKSTGAIDLAAGSSGVNISNGGTVTAITRTASGTPNYTTVPSVTLSAPTTAGGVQATASVTMFVGSATVSAGGSGYLVGDVLTVSGGTGSAPTLTVATLSGSAVATVTITNAGALTALPSNPVSVTGGTGTNATFTIGWGVNTIVVGTAGSGYVEQPTVTFSSGSATAYATVGSDTTIKSLGTNLNLSTPSGTALQVTDVQTGTVVNNWVFRGAAGTGTQSIIGSTAGTATNINMLWLTKGGSGLHQFATSSSSSNIQFQVANTTSAVNYVQVTGGATTVRPRIDFTGSDLNVGGAFVAKGSGAFLFASDANASTIQFFISRTGSATNYLQVTGGATGSAPVLSAQGSSDTDVDITFTPKGAGAVRFGTYTASVLTPTGYITIKDSGGTSRRLLVG